MIVLAVDGNNQMFASNSSTWLARKSDGFATHAIIGFFRSLRYYTKEFVPDMIIVVWDGGKSKVRMELCPEYKANRIVKERTPEEQLVYNALVDQTPIVKGMLGHLGAYQFQGFGIEGDDLLALVAQTTAKRKDKCVIVSNDTDFLQLIGPNIDLFRTVSVGKKPRHITVKNMEETYGLKAEQWLDYKCLVGDSSDNIAGIPGIGEKTAKALLVEHGSIEAFCKAAPSMKKISKRLQGLLEHPEIIERNRKMMGLQDIPTEYFQSAKIIPPNVDDSALRECFREYEWKDPWVAFNDWISPFYQLQSRQNGGTAI